MKSTNILLVVPVLFFQLSCSTPRGPANLEGSLKVDLDSQYTESIARELKHAKKDQHEAVSARNVSFNGNRPESYMETFSYPHHKLTEKFLIPDLNSYAITNVANVSSFVYDATNTIDYKLELVNKAIMDRHQAGNVLKGTEFFNAQIECDGSYKVRADQRVQSKKAGEKAAFRIYGQLETKPAAAFVIPGADVKSCLLRWENKAVSPQSYGVRLVNEAFYVNERISAIRSSYQNCIVPQASENLSGMQKFFLSSYRQLSCPREVGDLETLAERIQGFNAKIEALLGYKLTEEQIEKQDPYLKLDFSKAPKLDYILVSYLVYQADFSGMLITRLLEWHAQRGTQVRIFVSDVLQVSKSDKMLAKLAENPNVKVKEYRFNAKSPHGTIVSQLHRVNHIKIFSTVSFTKAKDNLTIIGGRNIHDGFLFKVGADHSATPSLINYNKKGLAYWRDFEVLVRSVPFTQEVVGQFYTSWDQDANNSYVRSWVQNISSSGVVDAKYFSNANSDPLIRHYISTPYVQGRLIQDVFADMVDKAQKKILISTPYFRLSKELAQAFERAVARGVDITVITRMNLDGDTLGSFLGETNKAGINKFYDKVKVYNYNEEKVILHSKLVLIDDEFSFLGSVNLNRRSFIHDTENALMVYSPAYNKSLTELYEKDYISHSVLITEKQKQVFWKKILIDLFSDKF